MSDDSKHLAVGTVRELRIRKGNDSQVGPKPRLRTIDYVRVSTETQVLEGVSLDAQRSETAQRSASSVTAGVPQESGLSIHAIHEESSYQ
jgi:hypothetical protein